MKLFAVLFLIFELVSTEWYDGANFYQIFPRSFKDSDGDGVGDLQGIRSKLPYLKSLGIDGIWLSPIYKSPMADFGYDISDFRDIQTEYGTLSDFDQLVEDCSKVGLKLVLDFVPNHTSDEHEWFKKSERREAGFEDFYIWRPAKIDPISNIKVPYNNWLSVFRGSAWRWSDIREEMYYHFFQVKQVDLNYRNPRVIQEMKDVLDYWMEKGVAGFRIDAISNLFEYETENGALLDEPRSYNPDCDRYDDCYLKHIYIQDQDETFDMVYQWRQLVDDFSARKKIDPKVLMTESTLQSLIGNYGNGSREGAQVPFNFHLTSKMNINSTAEDYKKVIEEYFYSIPKGKQANWVLGNHDLHRAATRLGVERGDLLNIMIQTLPGIAITYQGEELCMTNVHLSWEETADPLACNAGIELYEQRSRDVARTPFPWDTTNKAGFTTGDKTWLPVGENYKTVNVLAQENAENSHLKIFKRLVSVRKLPVFKFGNYSSALSNDKNVYSFMRDFGSDLAITVLNFGVSEKIVNLTSLYPNLPKQLKVYTSSLSSGLKIDEIVETDRLIIKGSNGILLMNGSPSKIIGVFMTMMMTIITFVLK